MVVVKWVLIHSHTSGFRSEEPIFLFFFLCAGSALRGAKWSNKKAPTIQGTGDWFAVPGGVRARLAGPPLGSVEQSALMKDAALFLFFFLLANPGFGAPQTSSLKVISAGGAVPARGPFLRGPLAPTGRLALKTPLVR